MAGFVDDNSCQANSHPLDRHNLITNATHNAQLWNDILYSSGGILEHAKCSYHYICTDFDSNGTPYMRPGCHGEPIMIRDHQQQLTTLKQLSVYTPYKTLGTIQCPGQAQRGQISTLIRRSKERVRTLSTSTFRGQSAWMFFSLVYCKSVGYPLAICRIQPKHLQQIQGPMIPVILNRLGYDRRLARSLTFGPRYFGGLGIPNLIAINIASQISLFIRHLRTQGQLHDLLRINLTRMQHTAGIREQVFLSQDPTTTSGRLLAHSLPKFASDAECHHSDRLNRTATSPTTKQPVHHGHCMQSAICSQEYAKANAQIP
jgi:hypothetical protein